MSKYSLIRNHDEPLNSEQPQRVEHESLQPSTISNIVVGILVLILFTLLFTMVDIAACLVATPILMNINGIPVNMSTYPMIMTYLYTTDQSLFYEIMVIVGIWEFWWGFNKFQDDGM